jgi:multidrug efflux system outer membrane protein
MSCPCRCHAWPVPDRRTARPEQGMEVTTVNNVLTHRPGAAGCLRGVLCAILASCTVGPDYQRPVLDTPAAYKSAAPGESGTPPLTSDWWRVFRDPDLDALEQAAIKANPDLKAAMARVMEARAAARIAQGAYYPMISTNPLVDRTHSSANGPRAGAGGTSTQTTDIQIPFDLSYEVDIWGRVRRSVEASTAQAQATAYDFEVVLQTLQADVAQSYFTIRSLDSQIQVLSRTVDLYRRQQSLYETQFRAGLVSRIIVVQTETQLYSAMTQETELRRQRADQEHALAILLGRPPSELTLAPHPLEDLRPPVIPAGLPADLLRKRPDVAEAERMLAAASAQIGVATAQFYPDLRLTGATGFESTSLQNLLNWESVFWSIGASALVPIFQGGQLSANLDQAKARYDEMLATYHSRVLGAFRDVEDALTDLHLRADASEAQTKSLESAREYVRLATIQYQRGLVSYLLVVDAQRTQLANELVAVQLLNQRMVSTVLLIKALGAGWDLETPSPIPQP